MKQFFKKGVPIILLLYCMLSYSQVALCQLNITGKVVDNKGEPITGVNVVVKGTTQGAITDIDGNFTLSVPSEDAVLSFSAVGYLSEEVKVGNQKSISVTLEDDLVNLSEVVVVGYGTMKKSDLTGSISSIKAKDIKDIPVRSVTDALQGKVSGVTIASTSGSPGSLPAVYIRGIASVNGTAPIYVVDGVPYGDVSWLNSGDIESMEVLKDASACAIYGSRGTNGVIMITTKKGSIGKSYTKLNLDVMYGIQSVPKKYDMMNAEEFLDYKILANQNGGTEWDAGASKDEILAFLQENFGSTEGTNWQNEIFENNPIQNYSLSLSAGNDHAAYYSSLTYLKQDGIVKGADFERITWNNNVKTNFTKWARLTTDFSIVSEQRHNIDEDNIFTGTIFSAMAADPVSPVYRTNLKNVPDAIYNEFHFDQIDESNPLTFYSPILFNNKNNPVAQTEIMHHSVWKDFTFRGGPTAEIDLTSWLQYKGSIHFNLSYANPEYFVPKYNIGLYQNESEGYVGNASYVSKSYVFDNYLTVDKKYELFGQSQHTTFMVGTSTEYSKGLSFSAYRHVLVSNDESQQVIDAATGYSAVGGSKGVSGLQSYFGRFFHSWNERYMFTANLRYDGSSSFTTMHKWAFFPSASVAYAFSEEEFLDFLKDISLSSGKLRFSWGENGNQAVETYMYQNMYSLYNGNYLFGRTYSNEYYKLSGGRESVGNPDLKWETSEQIDIGTDLYFFSNKLSFTFDYYNKKTKDMLWSLPLPVFLGYPNDPIQNVGTVRNIGIELGLDYKEKLGDLGFEVSGTFSANKNKVLYLADGLPLPGGYYSDNFYDFTKTEEGKPIGYFYGYKANGIFQSQEEIDNYTNAKGNSVTQEGARPGDLRYVDVNEDGEITAEDYTDIGNPFPDFTYGFNLNLNYKGFDLVASFYGVHGNEVMNIKKIDFYSGTAYYNAPKDLMTNAWTEENHSNTQFRISTDPGQNQTVSSWLVEDGSYFRLQNLQLGYTLPEKLSSTLKMKSCRVWIGGTNLFTLTDYSGMSPEIGSQDPTNAGVDIGFYPQPRQVLMGLNIQF
jgi:TonB-dependent starch-binding outer membrane protein SusC